MDSAVFAPVAEREAARPRWPLRDDVFALDAAEWETEIPKPYATMPLGVDLSDYQAAGRRPQPVATFQRLARLGKVFAIVKSSQGQAEATFRAHYDNARAAGLIRGSYHFFTTQPVADQVRLLLGLIPRVGPGELAPALDVEDGKRVLWQQYRYTYDGQGTAAGSTRLLDDLQDWLDRVEAALGRTPLIYTGVIWRDGLRSKRMAEYPLWTLPNRFPLGGWRRVEIWQYAEDGEPKGRPYHEPGVDLSGVDFDAYNGTLYGLRGLADLGRVGVGVSAVGVIVAHVEPDGHLHLVRDGGGDTDLMRGGLPGLGADPAVVTSGTGLRLYFRSDDRIVEASQADPAASWDVEDLSTVAGVTAVHDPRAVASGGRRIVVFSGADGDWHLLTRTGSTPWTATPLLSSARRTGTTSVPPSSGQPTVYLGPGSGEPRIVGRAGPLGHLIELALGSSGWVATDLTATASGPHGTPPAATYSPAVYQDGTETFVVYRAIRGELWQIARGSRRATNLSAAAAGSEVAVGHPCCFVLAGQVHVVYRGVDQAIHDITLRNGQWTAVRLPCDRPAASDPTCAPGLVAYRAMDGVVSLLRFDGSGWTCTDLPRPAGAPSPTPAPAPAPAPAPIPAPVEPPFAARFRALVAAGDERGAVSLAYQNGRRDVTDVTDLVFFARHQELGGRRLRPDETALAKEWRTIRDQVVAPGVAALAHGGRAVGESADEAEPGAGEWLRAVAAAQLEFEGIGDVIGRIGKTVSDVVGTGADVLARAVGQLFADFVQRLDELERMAIADGYTLTQRITAFRKVFYGSFHPCGVPAKPGGRPYPGVTGGGAWDILIPGAAATPLPPSWTAPAAAEKVTALCNQSMQVINGVYVHVGHVFTGLDARNYPTRVQLKMLGIPLIRMRSNLEAATFVGDLGSVVVEYLHDSTRSFRDTAMDLDAALLAATYDKDAGPDMTGNADAHLVVLDPSRTVVQNLSAYYTAPVGGWRRRWQGFVVAIGLGSFTPVPPAMPEPYRSKIIGIFSGLTEQWRSDMQGEIMEAALAYAAAKGHRSDVVNVLSDPGPGLAAPTFWEMYWNASGWVLDEFLSRLKRAVATEP